MSEIRYKVLYLHALKHTCLPALRAALSEIPGMLYGTVVQCPKCKQTWMLTPRRLWLRRHIVNEPGSGFWVREPLGRRQDRRKDIEEDFENEIDDALIKAAGRLKR